MLTLLPLVAFAAPAEPAVAAGAPSSIDPVAATSGADSVAATSGADSVAATSGADVSADVQLAGLLGGADTIDWIRGDRVRHTVTFGIERAGEAFDVVVTTGAKGSVDKIDVIALGEIIDDGGIGDDGGRIGDASMHTFGSLGWLVEPMQETTSVARLIVDRDGAVTIITGDGERYMAIPGRGSGGNAAVEARWAAAWDRG